MSDGKNLQQQQKMIQKQLLKVREHSRKDLLEKEKQQMSKQKLTFNINFHRAFQNIRSIMEELHILLTPNKNIGRYSLMRLFYVFGMARVLRITQLELH